MMFDHEIERLLNLNVCLLGFFGIVLAVLMLLLSVQLGRIIELLTPLHRPKAKSETLPGYWPEPPGEQMGDDCPHERPEDEADWWKTGRRRLDDE